METRPLLSIAIATKNREKFCIEAIKSILSFNSKEIEITVADNSDTDQIKQFVEALNSPSIKYIYDNARISSIDNFNRAMHLATGEYVMLIGDDDSVHIKILDVVKWMKINNIDTACSKDTITFLWPGAHPAYPNGHLTIPSFSDSYVICNPKDELIKLLNNGLVNYFFYKVPKSYHGIVKKKLMDEVKEKTGNYYGALSPDIFSVISLSLIVKKHAILDYPISIAGVCSSSTTSDQIKGKHSGYLKDMPHLKNRSTPYKWDLLVPKIYSVPTIWADSGLNALSSMGASNLRSEFHFYSLIAHIILINRKNHLKLSIIKCDEFRKSQKISFLFFWFKSLLSMIKLFINKVDHTKSVNQNSVQKYDGIENFDDVFMKINDNNFYKTSK